MVAEAVSVMHTCACVRAVPMCGVLVCAVPLVQLLLLLLLLLRDERPACCAAAAAAAAALVDGGSRCLAWQGRFLLHARCRGVQRRRQSRRGGEAGIVDEDE